MQFIHNLKKLWYSCTLKINFTSKKFRDVIRHIGDSKYFKPKQIYLGNIDFKSYWRNINKKAELNVKLTGFEEITLLLTCLMPECKNKAKMLDKISKLLKNEKLFDENRFEYIQAIISLEIENFISEEEQAKILGEINMSPQAQKTITEVINEVNRKSLYEERLSGIDEGIEIGKKEGKKEGIEEVAKKLKDIISDEEISKHTGLSVKRIQQL